jgi:hypothetical protein
MLDRCQVGRSFRPVYGYAIAFCTSWSYGTCRMVTQWGLFLTRGTFTSTQFSDLSTAILGGRLCGLGRTSQIHPATAGLHDEINEIESSTETV